MSEVEFDLRLPRYGVYVGASVTLSIAIGCLGNYRASSALVTAILIIIAATFLALYFIKIPEYARKHNIRASPGRNFTSLFHLSFIFALVPIALIPFGLGQSNALGKLVTASSIETLSLHPIGTSFTSSTGYVATNLSISLITTLLPHPIPPWDSAYQLYPAVSEDSYERVVPSSYYGEALVIPTLEFNVTDRTVSFPDARGQVTVAPVFESELSASGSPPECLTGSAPVHRSCPILNRIVGFAIRQGACTGWATGCHGEDSMVIEPSYECSSDLVHRCGLRGIVVEPPSDAIQSELRTRLLAKGWSFDVYSFPILWVKVSDLTPCERDPVLCKARLRFVGLIGLGALVIVLMMIIVPLVLDIYLDVLIKRVLRYDA